MTWWCSAQGTAWSWSWQPYPGVWILVALLIGGYVTALRRRSGRPRPRPHPHPPARPLELVAFALGVLTFWLAADWPIGPLGAGYLVSVNTLRYLLFALVAPPLLIGGTPTWLLRAVLRPAQAARLVRFLSRPLIAFVIFNTVLVATHLPTIVDSLAGSQLGSFTVDMAWFVSGLIFWWPVLGPLPELGQLSYPARLVYLIMNVFIPTIPAAFLTFADYPIYALYELAPRIGNLSATADQQLAGLTMKVVGGFIIFGTASVLFFRWYAREEREDGVM